MLLMTGCSLSGSNNNNTSNGSANSNISDKSGSGKSKGDFSSPKAAVYTFIAAGTNRDAEMLSQCFDAESPGEFRKLREKTASQKDLDGLAEFVNGAQITEAKESGDRAVVGVKFKARNEEISMKKSAAGWKILDF
jgi:hypothetical protein